MKKSLSIIVLVLVAFSGLNAQDIESKLDRFRFGLKVTPGISWLNTSAKKGQDRKGVSYSFGYGLQGDYRLTKNIAITSGLMMNSFRGGVSYTNDTTWMVYDISANGITTKDTVNISSRSYTWNSVDLPIKLKLSTPEIGYITYFAEFGATFNFIYKNTARKNIYINDKGAEVQLTEDNDEINNANDTRYVRGAMDIGLGIEYNFTGSTSLLLGLNWSNSFLNSLDDTSESLFFTTWKPFEQSVKADYIALSVGVLF